LKRPAPGYGAEESEIRAGDAGETPFPRTFRHGPQPERTVKKENVVVFPPCPKPGVSKERTIGREEVEHFHEESAADALRFGSRPTRRGRRESVSTFIADPGGFSVRSVFLGGCGRKRTRDRRRGPAGSRASFPGETGSSTPEISPTLSASDSNPLEL
jgi:hypothetical protein